MGKHIPNFITILNLLAGCLSVYYSTSGDLVLASWLIFIAAIFDFLDGMAARLLHAKSPIGGVLDSLADVISFGLAPGFIMFEMIKASQDIPAYVPFIAFIIPALSALRLAKFSVDERQSDHFLGLPTPANALLIASFPLILGHYTDQKTLQFIFSSPYVLIPLSVVLSILLVTEIPLMALKFKNFKWQDNQLKFLLIITSIVLILIFKCLAVPFIFLLYFGFSFLGTRRGT
jgi:CDP-diacylglycerol---serine O-phosphatidyltransferase